MPKRTAAEAFSFYMPILLNLIKEEHKETANKYFEEWKLEIQSRKKNKLDSQKQVEDITVKIEQYLNTTTIPQFNVTKEHFITIEDSATMISKLIASDKVHHGSLLRSAAYQGYGFKRILELSDNKKNRFVANLELFRISYNVSYCYFLMNLSDLILPHVLFLNSSMPISFVRKHFKEIKIYIEKLNQPTTIEEMRFGSQDE